MFQRANLRKNKDQMYRDNNNALYRKNNITKNKSYIKN